MVTLRAAWAVLVALLLSLRSGESSQEPGLATQMEVEVLPRPGASTREREIAAVFRGVAYGAQVTRAPNSTLPTPPSQEEKLAASPPTASATPGNVSLLKEDPTEERNSSRVRLTEIEASEGVSTRRFEVLAGPTVAHEGHRKEGNRSSGSDTPSSDGGGRGRGGGGGVLRPDATVESQDIGIGESLSWWLQVYLSAGLYTLLAITSLCLMSRASAASGLLPRPHYLSLHALLSLSAFSRGLHILQEAHAVEHLLPPAVSTAVEEVGWPLLTGALAVAVVGGLRAWHRPSGRPCVALTLALATGLHLFSLPVARLLSDLLQQGDLPILPTARVAGVTLGGAVGVAGLWAAWASSRCGRPPHPTQMGGGSVQGGPVSSSLPANFVLAAAVTQLLLSGFNLYVVVVPETPPEWAWAWWCRLGLSRGLEMLMGGSLLSAAAVTVDQLALCALNCCRKRTVELVHPSSSSSVKMIHPLGVYTLQQALPKNEHAHTIAALSLGSHSKLKRDHKSLDYVTSDFQLVWSHAARPLAASQAPTRFEGEFLQLQVDKEADRPRNHVAPKTPQDSAKPFVGPDVFTCSLPTYKLYATPEGCYRYDEDVKALQELGISCDNSVVGEGKVYSSPQVPLRASRSWDELSTSHIYEEPQRTTCGSVDEALSDLSDIAGVSDLSEATTDFPSDAGGYGDLRSPLRVPRNRLTTAHYVGGKHLKAAKLPNATTFPADPVPAIPGKTSQLHGRTAVLHTTSLHHNQLHSGGLNFT